MKKLFENQNLTVKDGLIEKGVGLAFSLACALPIVFSVAFLILASVTNIKTDSDLYLYFGFLLPQISFAIVIVWFLKYLKQPIKNIITSQKCELKYVILALTMQIGLFALSQCNTWFLEFLSNFGYENTPIVLPNLDGFGFIGCVIVVALLPAIFEELFFRGVVLLGLKNNFKEVTCIILCGGLFSIFHQNPAQTVYQFCCGCAFAWIAIRANSVFPTIVSHFINNFIILILYKLRITTFSPVVSVLLISVSVLSLIGTLFYMFKGDKGEKVIFQNQHKKTLLLYASAGVVLCLIGWISVLVAGF